MIRLIENLCAINGVSGDEQDVAAAIIEQIKDYCEYEVTPLGDVIAFKKGAKHPRNRVMFDAHMDEVGLSPILPRRGFCALPQLAALITGSSRANRWW